MLFASATNGGVSPLLADDAKPAIIVIEGAQSMLATDLALAAPIAGRVTSLAVAEGQRVSANDLLVQLDDRRARAELAAAEAAAKAAELSATSDVDQRYAERTREVRMRELEQSIDANKRYKNSVTATEIDRLQLVIDQAGLSIEQARKELEVAEARANEKRSLVKMAELKLRDHRIGSPIVGSVAETMVSAGEWVDAGTPLLRLVSLDPIRVSGFVDGRQYGPELKSRPVEFEWTESLDGEETVTKLQGEVTFVSQEVHPVNSQIRVWASFRNPDEKARPGIRGTMRILPATGEAKPLSK
ncbi:efflux RND transporter periplasmic adaptor subunit [Rhodopirellula bahusiensis]|uniref:efflux RND transporter periplasmic adaptor subunit n=1 Tax=Rhodopirellula bahusiensis TaxID=2014065 RepID=UPI003267B385